MNENSITFGSSHELIVNQAKTGLRLDAFLSSAFPDYSRSFLQKIIKDELVFIDGKKIKKPSVILKQNQIVKIIIPQKDTTACIVQKDISSINAQIIFQNNDFAIINKPAGLIVHSNHAKMTDATLVDWLTFMFPNINTIGYQDRPGIVHRLDKNTSGLMVIPLTNPAFAIFSALFKDRHMHKTYLALVKGHPEKEGILSSSIARHPTVRNKMTLHTNGRTAQTHFKVLEYFQETSLMEVKPVTGRTHQIRVHFSASGHSLIGDEVYGSRSLLIDRHALHAQKIAFNYKGTAYEFEQEAPEDFKKLIASLSMQKAL